MSRKAAARPTATLLAIGIDARGGKVASRKPNLPTVTGALPNPGFAA